MAYKELLSEIIKKSGLSLREISKRCESLGVPITPSYISQLQTGKLPPASEENSRALAKVCGYFEDKLVLEAYLENAPHQVLEFIKANRFHDALPKLHSEFENLSNDEKVKAILGKLEEQPLSEYIIDTNLKFSYQTELENSEYFGSSEKSFFEGLPQQRLVGGSDIEENGMSPLIPSGSQVTFDTDSGLKDGNIVGFIPNGEDKILLRKYYKKNDLIILISLNDEFEPLTFKNSEIYILGKVKEVLLRY